MHQLAVWAYDKIDSYNLNVIALSMFTFYVRKLMIHEPPPTRDDFRVQAENNGCLVQMAL